MPTVPARRSLLLLALVACAGAAWTAHAAEPGKAARTEKGQTLAVPAEHASMGRVYYVLPGKDAQVTFESDAPLEHIKGVTNKVVGYAVGAKAEAGGAPIVKGQFNLPVASLNTGIPLRNEHVQSEGWMNAGSFPDVIFTLNDVKDAKVAKQDAGFTTYTATLVGVMTVKGVSKDMSVPARLVVMPESDKTKARAAGDLLAIRATYTIKMSDFGVGVGNPAMQSGKISDELKMDTSLFLSTVSPETPAKK